VIVFVEHREDVEEEKGRVRQLLDNLRIDAILIVLCLSSTQTYRCIINGETDLSGRVEEVLGEDQWWIDLKQLRQASASSTPGAASAFRHAKRAFVHSLADHHPMNRGELIAGHLSRRTSTSSTILPDIVNLALPKRRQSMAVLPPSFTMRMSVSKPGYFNHASSESSSEDESETDEDYPIFDADEAIAPDDSDDEGNPISEPQPDYFSSSYLSSGSEGPKTPKSPLDDLAAGKRAAFSASAHASLDVDDEDKPHVSFKATPHPFHHRPELELDFNTLPAKAQYLILNDLIRSHSEDTAVVFTTLPAPPPGTHQEEEKSVEYVSGLELMCEDIPPVLLIHSNSLVVTLAL